MKKIILSNELFKIFLVETYEPQSKTIRSHYELFEGMHIPVEIYESLPKAEQTMHRKTEFWKQLTQRVPLYIKARFIA